MENHIEMVAAALGYILMIGPAYHLREGCRPIKTKRAPRPNIELPPPSQPAPARWQSSLLDSVIDPVVISVLDPVLDPVPDPLLGHVAVVVLWGGFFIEFCGGSCRRS